jgi:hypothetical protein
MKGATMDRGERKHLMAIRKHPQHKTNNKALDKFVTTIVECQKIVSDLQKAVDNHLDTNPDTLNWANVGDAQRLLEDLREVQEYVKSG